MTETFLLALPRQCTFVVRDKVGHLYRDRRSDARLLMLALMQVVLNPMG